MLTDQLVILAISCFILIFIISLLLAILERIPEKLKLALLLGTVVLSGITLLNYLIIYYHK